MSAFYLADHAHLWARFAGFSTSGKVLVGFFALVAAAAVYLAWEFHVAPLIPNPGDTQAGPAIGRASVVAAKVALMTDTQVATTAEAIWNTPTDFDVAAEQACHLTETEDPT